MSFSDVSGCAHVRTYEAAEKLFTHPKPRGSRWDDNERPLDIPRAWHYRVEKDQRVDAYNVCLYHTTMAKYYKPEPDGTRVVEYTGDGRVTSGQFMWRVLGVCYGCNEGTDTNNQAVAYPIYYANIRNKPYSAKLVLTEKGRIITDLSEVCVVYTSYFTPEERALRKDVLNKLAMYWDLARMRVQGMNAPRTCPYMDKRAIQACLQDRGETDSATVRTDLTDWLAFHIHTKGEAKTAKLVRDILYPQRTGKKYVPKWGLDWPTKFHVECP